MAQRIGPYSRMVMIKEADWGVDPGSPVKRVVPLSAEDQFKSDQPRTPAKIYDGTRRSKGSVKGMKSAVGTIPVSMDFDFIGLPIDVFLGHSGYSRVGSLHRWIGPGDPGSVQIQREHLQSPILYKRSKGVRFGSFEWNVQMSGQAIYSLGNLMGMGRDVLTDVGGTYQDDTPHVGFSYFDGSILKDGVPQVNNVTTFNVTENNNLSRQDAAFSGGEAAGINAGIYGAEGDLAFIYDTALGDTYYLQALNDTIVSIECYLANKPLAAGPTKWVRKIWPAVLFSLGEVSAGGDAGKTQSQHFLSQVPTTDWPAEAFGSVLGPYNIQAGVNDKLAVKIDGAGSFTFITLAPGATRTAVQIAAEIDTALTAVADSESWNGYPKIKSRSTVAATSKVQIDVTQATSAHTTLGFTGTIFSGYAAADVYTEVFNGSSVDY